MPQKSQDEQRKEGRLYWVYDETTKGCAEEIGALEGADRIAFMALETFLARKELSETDRVALCARSDAIEKVMRKAECEGFGLMLFATKKQRALRRSYNTPATPQEALALLLEGETLMHDLLYRDEEEIVLYNAIVGEAPPLGYRNAAMHWRPWSERMGLFLSALRKIRTLKRSRVKLTTAKEQVIETAATGVVVLDQESGSCAANLIDERSWNDGRLSALLLSPASILSYLHYLLVAIFPLFRQKTLPDSVGLVESQSLEIETEQPMRVEVDGIERGTTPVHFAIHPKALRLIVTERFKSRSLPESIDKETIRTEHLPQGEEAMEYYRSHLPLFTHASEEQYRELFAALRSEAKFGATFVLMMIFSTVLATVGLFLNSASVIIGAMLLAPLMQPIVAFSMGALRGDRGLIYNGAKSVLLGVGLVLLSAMAITKLLPFSQVTSEMAGRLHPSLLDLIVAIVSGLAAAYAKNNPKISGSLVGVAIAVALVPPLSTAGIGLGWSDLGIFWHAFLLFLTNFVGIVLAAGLVFMVLGFSPIHRAKRGLLWTVATVAIVSIPLYFSFRQMAHDAAILSKLEGREIMIERSKVRLQRVRIEHSAHHDVLVCDLVVSHHLSPDESRTLRTRVSALAGEPMAIESVERLRF